MTAIACLAAAIDCYKPRQAAYDATLSERRVERQAVAYRSSRKKHPILQILDSCDRASLLQDMKEPTRCHRYRRLFSLGQLNMFRASLCSSSGEQTIQKKTACGVCLVVLAAVHTARVPTLHDCSQHNKAFTTRSFFCIVCSPDDEHNDARNMLS